MSDKLFRGSIVAIVTPFNEFLQIDYNTLGSLVEFHAENGTAGIVVGGCTGESFTLSLDEQMQMITFVVKQARGRLKVIPGTGSNSTREAVDLTRHAAAVKADGAMLITPYANKPTPAGLITHFTEIAGAVDIPIMLYNVPSRTGLNILPETVAELFCNVKNIKAIKEASGNLDRVNKIFALCPDIAILSGDDSLTVPIMSIGGRGVVSVTANIAPAEVAKVVNEFLNGKHEKATKLHHSLNSLHEAMFIETNPGPVKAAMEALDLLPTDLCRPPLASMTRDNKKRLLKILRTCPATKSLVI